MMRSQAWSLNMWGNCLQCKWNMQMEHANVNIRPSVVSISVKVKTSYFRPDIERLVYTSRLRLAKLV